MKKILLLLALVFSVFIFAGCSNDTEVDRQEETTAAAEETEPVEETGEAVSEETEAETQNADENPGYVRSHLTGEWIDEEIGAKRPIAVMINNIQAAIPQSGISHADVIYECMVEGSLTRLMALFQDVEGLDKIGPVRSARTYFVYLADEWNAFYFHFGQCEYAKPYLEAYITQNVNGVLGSDGNAFYRTNDRPAPHNAYTSGDRIEAILEEKAESSGYIRNLDEFYSVLQDTYTTEIEPEYKEHFQFAADDEVVTLDDGVTAENITVGFTTNDSTFTYDSATGKYLHSQYGGPHIDQETGEQLAFDNVLILYSEKSDYYGTQYLQFDLWSDGDGYYITQGKAIPIRWIKNTEWGPMEFVDESGNEITVNQGKTWISIVPTQDQDKTVIE